MKIWTRHLCVSAALCWALAASGCVADIASDAAPRPQDPPERAAGEACGADLGECAAGLECVGGLCEPAESPDAGGEQPQGCEDGRPGCGGVCCLESEVCDQDQCEPACPSEVVCEGICCGAGEVCEQGRCLPPCQTQRCGAELSLCCGAEEVCFGGACLEPGAACETTDDCAEAEICEPSLGRCLSRDGVQVCEFRPPVGQFEPVLGCRWTPEGLAETPERGDVVATPIVLNLTDDNEDGRTDTQDTPDIAFLTYDLTGQGCCNRPATLRIVSGQCEPGGGMRTLASLVEPGLDNSSGLAGGDLDGDGVPEIVGVGMFDVNLNNGAPRPQGVVVWTREDPAGSGWRVLWQNTTYPTFNVHTRGGALVSLADLEGDGLPEVIVGNVALNGQDGSLKWDGVVTSGGTGGIGNNAFLGPYSIAVDIDLDGQREVMAGNTLYGADGAVRWTFDYGEGNNSACGGNLACDGYVAAANFDDDPQGEIVIVRLGEVFVLEHDGGLLWRQAIPVDDCAFNESGPPTVADFDGDGRPEIGTAAADFYAVLDMDCDADPLPEGCASRGVLWAAPNEDCSSRVTASSVFDFEGDGKAEMIYADEAALRIFDGGTGRVLFQDDTHGSHTRIEMPVIADVDNDGNADIVIPENGSNEGTPGLEVFKDASDNWVRTRRIWNQHAYSVTNVTEDGRLPAAPDPNWLDGRLNNFRQNVQPSGVFDAPDLVLRALSADTARCGAELVLGLEVIAANEGALSVPAGIPVRVEALYAEAGQRLRAPIAELATTTRLLPGQFEVFAISWPVPVELPDTFSVRAAIDPDSAVNECIEDNNGAQLEVTCAIIR